MTREASHSTISRGPSALGPDPRADRGISSGKRGEIREAPATIAIESPLQDEVRGLVSELNAVLLTLTPPEHCYHLKPEEMAQPNTTVFVARIDGRAVAMGAIRRHPGGIGEVKRMYTRPEVQGRGIGGAILAEIEALARREGLRRLVLETGDRHPAAWRVYERGGFSRCGPFLDYPDTPYSVFYEKALASAAAPA